MVVLSQLPSVAVPFGKTIVYYAELLGVPISGLRSGRGFMGLLARLRG